MKRGRDKLRRSTVHLLAKARSITNYYYVTRIPTLFTSYNMSTQRRKMEINRDYNS